MQVSSNRNVDANVARGFGREWSTFRQGEENLSREQRETIFEDYFRIFPWNLLPHGGGVGIDIGCGTGRWSMMVAPRVAHLHLLDVSPEALADHAFPAADARLLEKLGRELPYGSNTSR